MKRALLPLAAALALTLAACGDSADDAPSPEAPAPTETATAAATPAPDTPTPTPTPRAATPTPRAAAPGDIRWETDLPGDGFGGATVVNDLVFTSVITGLILALDRETGEIVWKHQAAGGINGWPAIAGDTLLIPIGFADPGFLLALRLGG